MERYTTAWEHSPGNFLAATLVASAAAMIVGAVVDNVVNKLEWGTDMAPLDPKDIHRCKAGAFFAIQLAANIALLLAATIGVSAFAPWLQLTVSGMMFSVLFFAVQQNWQRNILALTNIA